jgi:DNA-binding FadR family transcriptional regulator
MQRVEAYDRFKGKLFRHSFAPGQFVSQRELTLALDMPIASVREAVRMLEQENLIRVIPQRGIQIEEATLQMLERSNEQVSDALIKKAHEVGDADEAIKCLERHLKTAHTRALGLEA